jgi:hypothetical protein
MKIIDKTPFLNDKGELGISQRIQGMLQYGFNWPNELQAQKAIITYFDRQLEKGYTLIRNYTLGQSGIMVPMILLGPTGLYVIHIAFERGRYEVKGDTWNVAAGEGYKPAPVNLIQKTMRMAKALRAFIERQGVNVPVDIEPVLIAGDPGLHIESVRPAIRVLMIDGIKSFVAGLVTGQPVLSNEKVYELTDRLLNPHFPRKESAMPAPSGEEPAPQAPSRARAIFDASQNVKPFNPSDFEFAMDEEPDFEITPPAADAGPVEPSAPAKPRATRTLGMTPMQILIVAALILALLCVLAGFGYYIFAFA